jgi:hypothetical protein
MDFSIVQKLQELDIASDRRVSTQAASVCCKKGAPPPNHHGCFLRSFCARRHPFPTLLGIDFKSF